MAHSDQDSPEKGVTQAWGRLMILYLLSVLSSVMPWSLHCQSADIEHMFILECKR